MKEKTVFLGNEICCGTYAFLNTVQDSKINQKMFEITSTVPFGIRHRSESDHSRLLTTYCDPNIGIDRAAELWGYRQKKETFCDVQEAVKYLLEKSKTDRCLVGPIDMGRLGYLVMPNLYVNMDHYITIFRENGALFCMDSEGLPVRKISGEELGNWLWVGGLPEAESRIAVRTYERVEFYSEVIREEKAIKNSLWLIRKNFIEARENGQGDRAIEKCWQCLQEKPVEKWRLSFLYDIGYLCQRKTLQQCWCNLLEEVHLLGRDVARETSSIVEEQIVILGGIFHDLKVENMIYEQHFKKLAELEKQLSIGIAGALSKQL